MLDNIVCDELGIARGSDAVAAIERLRVGGRDYFDGLLTTEDSCAAAAASLEDSQRYTLRVVKQLGTVQEKYCKLYVDGESLPCLVGLFGEVSQDAYPTDMENLVFWAIVQPGSTLGSAWTGLDDRRVVDWRRQLRGSAIVAEPVPVKDSVARTVAAIFGLDDAGMSTASVPHAMVSQASEVRIGVPGRAFETMQARLFFEAATTGHPKWRFLSLYRILENAYLSNIKKALLLEFDKDASRAVEDAKKKLQSEVNQLISLMTETRMEAEFLAFDAAFEAQLGIGNQYCFALDRNAAAEAQYGQGQEKRAVVRFYKMRCSIAHAGTASVIFEQLPDSVAATVALLPSVEDIVLRSLGITVR